ncbi:39S ribosomal protein L30, mitochondrial [Schistocerca nitens]|uniref:39S ribosomal protein L30, mitochondrial n=1 Tax=Schistocerca nitens TaxID=7011 RepID=UPI00211904F5|nr:39S ribosomal protein L30, mitochondrial [Schistocerca nitens]
MFGRFVSRLWSYGRLRNYSTDGGGIKYHGFTYYPRFPDFKDPPYEPSKLFMVQRVKALKGRPYWEKNMMKEIGLAGKRSDIVIMKNIPENNARLWQVKHLVKITPITCPNGLPSDGDYSGTYLKENGEFIVTPKLKVPQEQETALEVFQSKKDRLDGETLRKHLRLKWLNAW